jgi:urease accessory protein
MTGREAARVGGVRLELVERRGHTEMGFCYQQIPVRVMPPFELDGESASLLYLINLTAGLLDGDSHLYQIRARPGSRAVVTGQSATRVHPAVKSHATQQWVVDVEDDAVLVVLPGPAIPFQGCRYYQRGRVSLAASARVIWGDIWLAGRYARGAESEQFRFEQIVQDFEVERVGRLVYRDRFRWNGPWTPAQVQWYFGGALAAGSLFASGPVADLAGEPSPGLCQAIFPLESGDTCVRWCGPPAEVIRALVRTALTTAAHWNEAPQARPWLLESTGLSPIHWFSSC